MNRSTVPAPVTRVLDSAGSWLPRALAEVEERLERIAASGGTNLAGDATATLSAGGKRLRPLLVLICAGPKSLQASGRAAVAVELVHMATLVHDDVLDAAPLRRGRPTVFASSGRSRATATGDLLFSRAFAELAGADDGRQVALLASASVALARGELAQRRDAFDPTIPAARYFERCQLKTASLFECACAIGDGDGGLEGFGRRVGLAFQLLDDVLDVTGPSERTGKARGTDLIDGTVTLPLILARERDGELAATDLSSLGASEAEALCERIVATGATREVRELARSQVAEAKEALDRARIDSERRRLLELVADGVVERYASPGLEVLGEDEIAAEGVDEVVDLLLHDRPGELGEVGEQRLGAVVEDLVEAVHGPLVMDAEAAPLALGTAQVDPPTVATDRLPVRGLDELAAAIGADVELVEAGPLLLLAVAPLP